MLEDFFSLVYYYLSHIKEMFNTGQPRDAYGGHSVILANPHTWKGEGLGRSLTMRMGRWVKTCRFWV